MTRRSQLQSNDARAAAFGILRRVDRGSYADRLIDSHCKHNPTMDPREKGLMTELVYGVLRLRGRIDFALAQFSRQPLSKLEKDALLLLRLGAYQLLELDRIPSHAAVDATVQLAHDNGLSRVAGLLNATLRTLDREKESIAWPTPDNLKAYLQHVCSLPVWLAKELLRQFPNKESKALAEALAGPAPQALRVNTMKTDRETYLEALEAAGHRGRPCRYAPEGIILEERGENPLPGDQEGLYQVQDEASMLIAHLLEAAPEKQILDACAAPGGKTTHLSTLTGNLAHITALDKSPQRLALIHRGASRLGCKNIEPRCWDLEEQPDFLSAASFDRILVDAPCSGLGVVRRNPESRWSRKPADIRELVRLQQTILENVAPLLKPGGFLLYSVCTFIRTETDHVVEAFLEKNKNFTMHDFRRHLPAAWQEMTTDNGCLRTLPHHHDGMDAFFAARLQKAETA